MSPAWLATILIPSFRSAVCRALLRRKTLVRAAALFVIPVLVVQWAHGAPIWLAVTAGAGGSLYVWVVRYLRARRPIPISTGDLVRRLCIAGDSHEEATARIAVRLALAAGFEPSRAGDLLAAASLHDIGKSGLPQEILDRQGNLDEQEQRTLRSHTRLGYRMLAKSHEPMLDLAAEIALHHHENWDGSGYPHGFCGEAIPLPGRVVALAARLDDLVCAKASLQRIRAALSVEAGSQFDPALVEIMLADLPAMISARDTAGPPPTHPNDRRTRSGAGAWIELGRFRLLSGDFPQASC